METIPGPTVINVDFKAKPADEAERPFPPHVEPARPAPFRKRTSFLPVRFFSAKRLPPDAPSAAEPDGTPDEADGATDAAAVGAPARLILPPLPEEAPAAPLDLPSGPPAEAVSVSDPLLTPAPEPAEEVVPAAPILPPAAVAPEPAVDVPVPTPEPPAGAPAAPAPSAPVSIAPASQPSEPSAAPTADHGSRSGERGAAVQLTLGCEVAALRLTPSFRLGAVHLRALSEVVSLRFVAPREAENPLAAAVAFQIVHVELDPVSRRLKNLLLKPLDESREPVTPRPRLQVAEVGLDRGDDDDDDHNRLAPITVTAATPTSTTVQLFGTFHLGSIHFTPAFGVGTLRLELASDTVRVRVTPSTPPTARDLPPAFDLVEAELDAGGRLAGLRLTPGKG